MSKIFSSLFFILICSNIFLRGCSSQRLNIKQAKINDDGYKYKYFKEKLEGNLKRNDSIRIHFFKEFNDTLELYYNGNLIKKFEIFTKNNPRESDGYSGLSIKLKVEGNKKVSLKLLRQNTYVSFILDNRYSFYTIQYYGSIWYINARNKTMTLM